MDMKINSKLLIKERNKRAWSQQHLAEVAELSLRTVQRIENSGNASPESVKAIAASFELAANDLILKQEERIKSGRIKLKSVAATMTALVPILYLSITALYSSNISAEAAKFFFAGEVRINQKNTHAFGISLIFNQVHTLQIDSNHQILIITPMKNGEEAETEIRLLQRQRDSYNILHTAKTIGSSDNHRSYSYRVCGSEATFYSPAKTEIPKC